MDSDQVLDQVKKVAATALELNTQAVATLAAMHAQQLHMLHLIGHSLNRSAVAAAQLDMLYAALQRKDPAAALGQARERFRAEHPTFYDARLWGDETGAVLPELLDIMRRAGR